MRKHGNSSRPKCPRSPKHHATIIEAGRGRDQEKKASGSSGGGNKLTSAQELEYAALRDEIVTRTEIQGRIVQVNLTFIAAILAIIASGINFSDTLLMIYPPLGALIASWWAKNEYNRRLLMIYIHQNIAPRLLGLGWDMWKDNNDIDNMVCGRRSWVPLAKGCFYSFIQAALIGGILLSLDLTSLNNLEKVLFVVDLASFIFIFIGFRWYCIANRKLLLSN